jgi:hypothetical protein
MSNDVLFKKAIQQATRDIGFYMVASALLISVVLPLFGLGAVWVYGQYKINQIQETMQQTIEKNQNRRAP